MSGSWARQSATRRRMTTASSTMSTLILLMAVQFEQSEFLEQHLFGERLHKVIIGPNGQSQFDVMHGSLGGYHKNPHVVELRILTHCADQFEAVQPRHIPVNQKPIDSLTVG